MPRKCASLVPYLSPLMFDGRSAAPIKSRKTCQRMAGSPSRSLVPLAEIRDLGRLHEKYGTLLEGEKLSHQ